MFIGIYTPLAMPESTERHFCYICGDKIFSTKKELELHTIKKHPKDQCIFCNKKFKYMNSKLGHELICKKNIYWSLDLLT